MIRIYGTQNGPIVSLAIGGRCPHCLENSTFSLITYPNDQLILQYHVEDFFASYLCAGCSRSIPIRWTVKWQEGQAYAKTSPSHVLRVVEAYDFDHVPTNIRKIIEEALDCFSVNAFNGFAAVVRRAVQAICETLGAQGSARVQNQINEVHAQAMLNDDQRDLAIQIMLTGHDGAHPHLPEVDSNRAALLLELLQDITSQVFTRPGRIKRNAELRNQAIQTRQVSQELGGSPR